MKQRESRPTLGETERMTGSGMARNAAKAVANNKSRKKRKLDSIMSQIRAGRNRSSK